MADDGDVNAALALVGFIFTAEGILRRQGRSPEDSEEAVHLYNAMNQALEDEDASNESMQPPDPEVRTHHQRVRELIAKIGREVADNGLDEDEVSRNRGVLFDDDPRPRMRIIFWDIRRQNAGLGLADVEGQVATANDQVLESENEDQERRRSDEIGANDAGYEWGEEFDEDDVSENDTRGENFQEDDVDDNDQENNPTNDNQLRSTASQPQSGQTTDQERAWEAAYGAERYAEAQSICDAIEAQIPGRGRAMVERYERRLLRQLSHLPIHTRTVVPGPSSAPANQPQTPAAVQGEKRTRSASPQHSPDSGKKTTSPAQPVLKRPRMGNSGSKLQAGSKLTGRRAQPKGERKKTLTPQNIWKLSKGEIKKPVPLGKDWWYECCFKDCTKREQIKSDMQSHITWGHQDDFSYPLIYPILDEEGKEQFKRDGERIEHGFLIYKVEFDGDHGRWTGQADYPNTEPVHGPMVHLSSEQLAAKGLVKKKGRKSAGGGKDKGGKSPSGKNDKSLGNDTSQDDENPNDEQEGPSTPQRQVITRALSSASNSVQRRLRQTTLTSQLGLSPRDSGATDSLAGAGAQQRGGEATDGADDPPDGPVNTGTQDSA